MTSSSRETSASNPAKPGIAAPRTAAALVIGNELLTGKIQETNVAYLARELFGLGMVLRRVVFCTDEIEVIAADVRGLSEGHDHVFTSGGVGPTHDDVTIAAVAQAFGRELTRSPEIESLIRGYMGERCRERHLRMAIVPEGASLIRGARNPWPILMLENVYILPGLPEVFLQKLPILREHLGSDVPFVSRAVKTKSDEGELGDLLERLSHEFPTVAIGSYPRWDDPSYRVKVTFDGRDPQAVDRAAEAFLRELPQDQRVIDEEAD